MRVFARAGARPTQSCPIWLKIDMVIPSNIYQMQNIFWRRTVRRRRRADYLYGRRGFNEIFGRAGARPTQSCPIWLKIDMVTPYNIYYMQNIFWRRTGGRLQFLPSQKPALVPVLAAPGAEISFRFWAVVLSLHERRIFALYIGGM